MQYLLRICSVVFILLHLVNTKRNTAQSLLCERQQSMEEDKNMNLQLESSVLLLQSRSVMSDSLWPHGLRTPGFPVLHHVPELAQTHVHWASDAIHLSHPLLSPSPPVFNLSQHQGLFRWVCSLHQVAKVLELHLQHQSFQWIFRVDFL